MTKKNEKQNREDYSVSSQNALNPNSNQNLQEQLEYYKKLVTSQAEKISRMNDLLLRAVAENKRRVYKCPICQKNNDRFIRKQESPAVLLPHSVVSPSLLAHVITQKFVYSMPLYRQEQQMIDAGIPIVRKVLSD